MHSIESLKQRWAQAGLTFDRGPGGLPVAVLHHEGSEATVALHGAHVLSYRRPNKHPVLWQSESAVYEDGKAIRGGIPICWPWFANHPSEPTYPAHGVARVRSWAIEETLVTQDGFPSIRFSLHDSAETRATFPHAFALTYEVTLADRLRIDFTVSNPGEQPFTYTGALHSYFSISQIDAVAVHGLDGRAYIDSIDEAKRKVQHGPVRFAEEVDRIYLETEDTCDIVDEAWNRTIRVSKQGSRSTVVWNPWKAKAQRMPDFGDQEFREMLCVETANAADDAVTVPAQGQHAVRLEIAEIV